MSYEALKEERSRNTTSRCKFCGGVLFTWGESYLTVDPKVIHECRNCGCETLILQSEINAKEKHYE